MLWGRPIGCLFLSGAFNPQTKKEQTQEEKDRLHIHMQLKERLYHACKDKFKGPLFFLRPFQLAAEVLNLHNMEEPRAPFPHYSARRCRGGPQLL